MRFLCRTGIWVAETLICKGIAVALLSKSTELENLIKRFDQVYGQLVWACFRG